MAENTDSMATSLPDIITDRIVSVVSSRLALTRLKVASTHRVSCEGWLKLELLHDFNDVLSDGVEIRAEHGLRAPETNLPSGAADLAVRRGDESVLVELKTFPTNYGGSGKPITQFIAGVVADLNKLCKHRGPATGLVVWLAYPIPEPMPGFWADHLKRVEQVAARTRNHQRIGVGGGYVHLYVMQCK
jgi:hypothetical protein